MGRNDRTFRNGEVSSLHTKPLEKKLMTVADQSINPALRILQKAKGSSSEEKRLRRMRSFFASHSPNDLDQACQNELARWVATRNGRKLSSIGELLRKAVPDRVKRASLYVAITRTDISQPTRGAALAAVDHLRALDKEL